MKLIFRPLTFIGANKKCGMDPVSASIISGGKVLESGFGGIMQNIQNNRTMNFNHDEAILNREFQANMLERSSQLQYQNAQNLANQAFTNQKELQTQLYNQQKEFWDYQNDPSTQVQRLAAAGINPQVLAGGNGVTYTGSSIPQAPSVPTSSGVGLTVPSGSQASVGAMQSGFTGLVGSISGAIKDLAAASQSDASAKETLGLLQSRLKKLDSETAINEVMVNIQNLDYEIKKATKDPTIQKSWEELNKLIQETFLTSEQVDATHMKMLRDAEEKWLAKCLADESISRNNKLIKEIAVFTKNNDAYLRLLGSEETRNRAQAREANANASQTEFYTELNQQERESLAKKIRTEADNCVKAGKLSEQQAEQAKQAAALMAKDVKYYTTKMWIDGGKAAVDATLKAISIVKP